MTQYSGADEGTIVQDAGHRACTTCYPSAPIGDSRSLPTKMFTPEELASQKERAEKESWAKLTPAEKRARKREEKLALAATKNGRPLRFEEDLGEAGVLRLVISTEKDAEREWSRGIGDSINLQRTAGDVTPESVALRQDQQARADARARMRPTIAKALAEKHGTTALEEKRRLDDLTRDEMERGFPKLAACFEADGEDGYVSR